MELRELFYEKLKNKLDKQAVLQESLEGFVKKYTPVLERLVNEYPNFYFGEEMNGSGNMITIDEKTVPRIIERIHSLDPTSKEQFAKAIMNIFLNTLTHDLVLAKKSDDYKIEIIDYIRETEGSVKNYFSVIE